MDSTQTKKNNVLVPVIILVVFVAVVYYFGHRTVAPVVETPVITDAGTNATITGETVTTAMSLASTPTPAINGGWLPGDYGLLAWNYDIGAAASGGPLTVAVKVSVWKDATPGGDPATMTVGVNARTT